MNEKSKKKLFILRIPFPIDCEKVPEYLEEKIGSYEDYLNDLKNYTYFSMSNGPS